jgi:hypothetical protein
MVTNRDLLGIKPAAPLRVALWNGEDPFEELERLVLAACLHYGIDRKDLKNRLFLTSGRDVEIVIARQTRDGTTIAEAVVNQLIDNIRANAIDVVMIDPFVSSHRVTENDNMAIDTVASTWNSIAEVTNTAIELSHHARKTHGNEVGIEDSRGGNALIAKARVARVLNAMTKDQARDFGVASPRLYVQADDPKTNLTPPPDKLTWFGFTSVNLGNRSRPNINDGDEVGVATIWKPPDPFDGVTVSDLLAAQKAVATGGPWRENVQARDWVGKAIAKALGLDLDDKAHKAKVKALVKEWIKKGMLVVVERPDANSEKRPFVEVGQWATE